MSDLKAEIQYQADLADKLVNALEIQWKNVASSRDKLSNLVLDILSILQDGYMVYKKVSRNTEEVREEMCVRIYDLADARGKKTLSDLWLLLKVEPDHPLLSGSGGWIEGSTGPESMRLEFIHEIATIENQIQKEYVASTKTKMQVLIFYIFHLIDNEFKVFPIENNHLNIASGFSDFWQDFLVAINKAPSGFENGI